MVVQRTIDWLLNDRFTNKLQKFLGNLSGQLFPIYWMFYFFGQSNLLPLYKGWSKVYDGLSDTLPNNIQSIQIGLKVIQK